MSAFPFSYTLLPDKRRKRITVTVSPSGEVLVKTPPRVGKKRVEAMLLQHLDWISEAKARAEKAAAQSPSFSFAEGETLPVFGRECPIRNTDGVSRFEAADGGVIYLRGETFIQRQKEAEKVYKALAARIFPAMAARLAPLAGVPVPEIRIGRAGKSWGYCKRDGTITFSLRLAAMGDRFCEYVVAHELCHLIHFNHSPAFWAEVERVCPGGKALGKSDAAKAATRRVALLFDKRE